LRPRIARRANLIGFIQWAAPSGERTAPSCRPAGRPEEDVRESKYLLSRITSDKPQFFLLDGERCVWWLLF
jgi:hypothetical protein